MVTIAEGDSAQVGKQYSLQHTRRPMLAMYTAARESRVSRSLQRLRTGEIPENAHLGYTVQERAEQY